MNKGILFSGLVLIFSIGFLSGCYNDKEELLYPAGTTSCDTTAASTWSATVLPIINNRCASCHGGAAASGGGVNLDTYAGARVQALNGKLVGTISHAPGFIQMPQSGSKLSDCEIAKIKRWVNAGAQNN